jgi:hypothetical protein
MRPALALAILALGLGGCGHVRIQTNDPEARIYANGAFVGKGEAEVPRRMGPPASMQITVKGTNATVTRTLRREITVVTAVFALYSYGTSFIWAWQYPQEVFVALPVRAGSGWDEEPSGWDAPPPGGDATPSGWDAAPPGADGEAPPPVTSGDGR